MLLHGLQMCNLYFALFPLSVMHQRIIARGRLKCSFLSTGKVAIYLAPAWTASEVSRRYVMHRVALSIVTRTQCDSLLVEARKLTTSREMLLWMTPSEAPKALQTSECSELLDPMRASCWISAQH